MKYWNEGDYACIDIDSFFKECLNQNLSWHIVIGDEGRQWTEMSSSHWINDDVITEKDLPEMKQYQKLIIRNEIALFYVHSQHSANL